MISSRVARTPKPEASLWTWPIQITDYDRRTQLTAAERKVLTRELPLAMASERTVKAVLGRLSGLERLLAPIDDALAVVDSKHLYNDRVRMMILHSCAKCVGLLSGHGMQRHGELSWGPRNRRSSQRTAQRRTTALSARR